MTHITGYQFSIIDRYGFGLSQNGSLDFVNVVTAKDADLPDTFEPIAAVGWARLAPDIAVHRLPDYELGKLVTKRPVMGCDTAEVFALACGLSIKGPFSRAEESFYTHLCTVIDKYGLNDFFGHYPTEGRYHHGILPRGVDWARGCKDLPEELKRFRAAYRKLSVAKQMLVATIIWLYRGSRNDGPWMTGLQRSWKAVYGILELDAAGMLEDWGELVARYPGW